MEPRWSLGPGRTEQGRGRDWGWQSPGGQTERWREGGAGRWGRTSKQTGRASSAGEEVGEPSPEAVSIYRAHVYIVALRFRERRSRQDGRDPKTQARRRGEKIFPNSLSHKLDSSAYICSLYWLCNCLMCMHLVSSSVILQNRYFLVTYFWVEWSTHPNLSMALLIWEQNCHILEAPSVPGKVTAGHYFEPPTVFSTSI